MKKLLLALALLPLLAHAQSQEFISGPPTQDNGWKRDLCTVKGMEMEELFKFKESGIEAQDLAAMIPANMEDAKKTELLEMLHAVYTWPDAPQALVKMTYAMCMGYQVHTK